MRYFANILKLCGALLGLALMAQALPALAESAAAKHEIARYTQNPPRAELAAMVEQAARAGIADQDVVSILRLGANQAYGAAEIAALLKLLKETHAAGMPTMLVRDKMLEGLAKRVPAEAIAKVSVNLRQTIERASSQVRQMEAQGLQVASNAERTHFINTAAVLMTRYRAEQMAGTLFAQLDAGADRPSAARLLAALALGEVFLVNGASQQDALLWPRAALRADYSVKQLRELQKTAIAQLKNNRNVREIAHALDADGIIPPAAVMPGAPGAIKAPAMQPPFGVPGPMPGGAGSGAGFNPPAGSAGPAGAGYPAGSPAGGPAFPGSGTGWGGARP